MQIFHLHRMVAVLLCAAVVCMAQIVIESEISTDTINIFDQGTTSGKSRGLALAATLLAPGLGHKYLQHEQRAMAFFTSESFLLFSAVLCESYSRRSFANARNFAYRYAQAGAVSSSDEKYWKYVGEFLDVEQYNQAMELNRTPGDKYVDSHLTWRWIDETAMKSYQSKREDATKAHVASSFLIAGMVLNRVVAFIDIWRSTRYKGYRSSSLLQFEPLVDSGFGPGAAMTLRGSF